MSELRILGHKLSAKEIEYITRIRFSIQNPDINEFRLKNFLTSFSIPNFLVTLYQHAKALHFKFIAEGPQMDQLQVP